MTNTKVGEGREGHLWAEDYTEPSSASTEYNIEDNSDCHLDGSEEGECKKGAWTTEEDRELSRLIEVSRTAWPPRLAH